MVFECKVLASVGVLMALSVGRAAFGIGKDVSYVGTYVNVDYVQVGSGVAVVAGGSPYEMEVYLTESPGNLGSVSLARVTGPGGLDAGLLNEGNGEWSYEEGYGTLNALMTARGGVMTVWLHGVDEGDVSVNVGITDGTQAADAPHITNMPALQTVDALKAMAVTIDILTYLNGLINTPGEAELVITDGKGNVVFDVDDPDTVNLPLVVPANLLVPGQTYSAELTAYLRFGGGRTGDIYPSGSAWNATTAFAIQAVPEPMSLGMLGLGAVAMGWRRRRN